MIYQLCVRFKMSHVRNAALFAMNTIALGITNSDCKIPEYLKTMHGNHLLLQRILAYAIAS